MLPILYALFYREAFQLIWNASFTGVVFEPNGKHAYRKRPSSVSKTTLCLSDTLTGIDPNAEFISKVEKFLELEWK